MAKIGALMWDGFAVSNWDDRQKSPILAGEFQFFHEIRTDLFFKFFGDCPRNKAPISTNQPSMVENRRFNVGHFCRLK